MIGMYDRIYGISDKLGVPQHVDFAYTDRASGVTTPVLPRPRAYKLGSLSSYQLQGWLGSNVDLHESDLVISGLSRTHAKIKDAAVCTIDGQPHTVLYLDEGRTVTLSVLVRAERVR